MTGDGRVKKKTRKKLLKIVEERRPFIVTTQTKLTQPCGYCHTQLTDDECLLGDDDVYCSKECRKLADNW
jgi:hypothetical protein